MKLDSTSCRPLRVLQKAGAISQLNLINRYSSTSIVGTTPITVSLTSYGRRLNIVGYSIESLAQGSCRPNRFILWIDEPGFSLNDYPMLRRLVDRGLEIRRTKNYGPHKKSYPFARESRGNCGPLATADDDLIYPRGWLARLYRGYVDNPGFFVGLRGYEIGINEQGGLLPYDSWSPLVGATSGSYRNFLTGGAGAVFSPEHLSVLADAGEVFMDACPRADDIWINAMAIRANIRGLHLRSDDLDCLSYPRSQDDALFHSNLSLGKNDLQLQATLTCSDLEKIRGDLL